MAYRIKDYTRFQHFKDRNPPWVKLYRDLLDDPDWHELDPASAKILVMLWLIASEDESKNGKLPDNRRLCFRLRISEKELTQAIIKLSHWLGHDDISVISARSQDDAPERAGEETETKTETEHCSPSASEPARDGFAHFWTAYPNKKAKPKAEAAWRKLKPSAQTFADLMAGLERSKVSEQWRRDGGQFIPHPATWLNSRRWEDQPPEAPTVSGGQPAADHRPKPGDTRTHLGAQQVYSETIGWGPA